VGSYPTSFDSVHSPIFLAFFYYSDYENYVKRRLLIKVITRQCIMRRVIPPRNNSQKKGGGKWAQLIVDKIVDTVR
jgi:hypothetical protein